MADDVRVCEGCGGYFGPGVLTGGFCPDCQDRRRDHKRNQEGWREP